MAMHDMNVIHNYCPLHQSCQSGHWRNTLFPCHLTVVDSCRLVTEVKEDLKEYTAKHEHKEKEQASQKRGLELLLRYIKVPLQLKIERTTNFCHSMMPSL